MDVTLWAYLVGVQYKIPHPRVVAAEKGEAESQNFRPKAQL